MPVEVTSHLAAFLTWLCVSAFSGALPDLDKRGVALMKVKELRYDVPGMHPVQRAVLTTQAPWMGH